MLVSRARFVAVCSLALASHGCTSDAEKMAMAKKLDAERKQRSADKDAELDEKHDKLHAEATEIQGRLATRYAAIEAALAKADALEEKVCATAEIEGNPKIEVLAKAHVDDVPRTIQSKLRRARLPSAAKVPIDGRGDAKSEFDAREALSDTIESLKELESRDYVAVVHVVKYKAPQAGEIAEKKAGDVFQEATWKPGSITAWVAVHDGKTGAALCATRVEQANEDLTAISTGDLQAGLEEALADLVGTDAAVAKIAGSLMIDAVPYD